MVIKLSWMVLIFGVGFPTVLASPELTENLGQASEIRARRKEQAQADRITGMHTAQAKSDSQMALDRAKAGCVPVVAETGLDTRLTEGVRVKASSDSSTALGDGSLVCTKSGDTAEVWEGKVFQVKRIGPDHVQDYEDYFSKQIGGY